MDKIKGDVQRMVKRRKDSGFTLIELMIVIAVIGILAVVLVPKVGAVKTSAKTAGVDTNMRLVQAYSESQIDKWSATNSMQSTVDAEIQSAVTTGNDPMKNPFGTSYAFVTGVAPVSGSAGAVYVTITQANAAAVPPVSYKVTISGYDSTGKVYKAVDVTQ